MSDIAISRASRDTLSSLRETNVQISVSSERVGTGKRVNRAIDDPSVFFDAQSLLNQAGELERILDHLAQTIQVLKAADNGLTAIAPALQVARTRVREAEGIEDAFARNLFAEQFNAQLDQIVEIAEASDYRGKNLIGGKGNDLHFYFSDTRSAALTVESIDFTDLEATLGLVKVDTGTPGVIERNLMNGATPLKIDDRLTDAAGDFAIGDTITVTSGAGVIASYTVTALSTVRSLAEGLSNREEGVRAFMAIDGTLHIDALTSITISGGQAGGGFDAESVTAVEGEWFNREDAYTHRKMVDEAMERLLEQSTSLGANLTMVKDRETFMKSFRGTLLTGADRVAAADLEEEGASLLALRIRQQLSSSALTFSNTADQGILRLLGG